MTEGGDADEGGDGADEARAQLRSAVKDADVAKVRDCAGVSLACCGARNVVDRA